MAQIRKTSQQMNSFNMVRRLDDNKILKTLALTAYLLLLSLGVNFAVAAAATASDDKCNQQSLHNTFKVDCHPEQNATETECLARGCCWLMINGEETQSPPYVGEPSCFFPADFNCYYMKQIEPLDNEHKLHYHQHLQREDQQVDYSLNDINGREQEQLHNSRQQQQVNRGNNIRWLLLRKPECRGSGFVDDASELEVSVSVYGDSTINIKVTEPNRKRFEPSLPEIKLPSSSSSLYSNKKGANNLNVPAQDHDQDNDDVDSFEKELKVGQLVVRLMKQPSKTKNSISSSTLPSAGVLKVIHQPTGTILFTADFGKLIYSRQFIQLPTYLSSSYIYGLGQHMGESLLKSSDGQYAKSYTMFNYGHPPLPDGRTAYSTYPFYINLAQLSSSSNSSEAQQSHNYISIENFELRRKILATGALMLNSNAMDVLVHSKSSKTNDDAQQSGSGGGGGVTWRLVGGIVDLYLFAGPTPHNVIEQYQSLVGRPQLPPAWALGYHQSRLNYRELLQIKLAWAKTRSAGIPMESIWTDLEFMWRTTSYSLNNNELGDLVNILQKEFDMHYVPIVDPAISIREDVTNYEALKLADSMDMFAYYSPPGGYGESTTAVVTTWTDSKQAAVLDFTHPRIVNYLRQVLKDYSNKLNFDGLWLDMNEPEIFANEPNEAGQVCANDEKLQYLPGNRVLNERTLCMAAEFRAGKHFDLHNLYAFYQSKAHFEALKILNNSTRRPFIISRSQFPGQGRYSGSWLGDLGSVFHHLKWSLVGTIESNWFGQPLIGADICGFFGSTSDELCARWFSFGAFYPLARNHNEGSARDQDPGSLDENVQRAARVALIRRYSLLPYLYTLFYQNHLQGEPVVRSVLFESFEKYYLNTKLEELPQVDDQMMLGSGLMIAPILESNVDSRTIYLPPGRWYDVSIGLPGSNMELGVYDALTSNWPSNGTDSKLEEPAQKRINSLRKSIDCRQPAGCKIENQYTPVGAINLYLRGGTIIPTFRNVDHEMSVNKLWKNASFFLEIGLDLNEEAFGSLFWDDGESDPEANRYNRAHFWLSHNRLMISVIENRFDYPLTFDGFVIHGAKLSENQVPKTTLYKDSRLLYTYDSNTETLSCQFLSPENDKTKPLVLGKFEKLVFKW